MTITYLALGSNLGDRQAHLLDAIARLNAAGVETLRRSSIIETPPAYVLDQPHFLNMVIEAQTSLFVTELLRRTQQIERDMGRRKIIDKGPRLIDIDILLFGNLSLQSPKLTVPHPLMHERPFVLVPLAELIPLSKV